MSTDPTDEGNTIVLGQVRRIDESLRNGDDVESRVLLLTGKRVSLGVTAPDDFPVLRTEIDDEAAQSPVGEVRGGRRRIPIAVQCENTNEDIRKP